MKRLIVLLCAGLLLSTTAAHKIYGNEGKQKLKWRFDFFNMGYRSPIYDVKFMTFIGPVGIGTANRYDLGHGEYKVKERHRFSWFVIGDTTYSIDIGRKTPYSYLPIMIHYTPYSKPLLYGNIDLYGFLYGSLWSKQKMKFTEDKSHNETEYFAIASLKPSSWFYIGAGLSFNPFRFIPFELTVGYLRVYYPYNQIPEPYKDYVSRTDLSFTRFRFTVTLRYQSAW
jgi:hypothetical protein